MRKLFLTSTGLSESVRPGFLEFLGRDPKGLRVAFIPTAAYPEVNMEYVKISYGQLTDLGMEVFDVYLEKDNEKTLSEKLANCDIIYVNGGNTFYLLDWVRKSGFDKVIRKLLDNGKIYLGVSAGSYIACPSIEMSSWKHQDKNVVGLTDLTALNLVPFLIFAHYENQWKGTIKEESAKIKTPLVVLTDQQAVAVDGDKIKVLGEGKKRLYNGFKETE